MKTRPHGWMVAAAALCSLASAGYGQISQNFDSTALGSLPSGWTTSSTGTGTPWAVVNNQSHSASNSAFSNDVASVSSQYLVFPVITAAGPVRLDLWSYYDTEPTFDGWTVEIDYNGGGFNNIWPNPSAPNPWTLNGYNQAAISTQYMSPIAGQSAFSGTVLTWTEHTALIPANSGDQVTLRINMSSDSSVSHAGVWLDDINVTTSSNYGACCHATLGTCDLNTSAACTSAGGTFQGVGSSCPGPCPASGACCDTVAGTCTLTGSIGCGSPNAFLGEGSVCAPTNPCMGACCNASTAACTLSGPGNCPGAFQGTGSTCASTACPSQACCDPATGACTLVGTVDCASGTLGQGQGTTCASAPCPPPANDECGANNPVIVVGVPAMGSNVAATQSTTLTTVAGDPFCGQATFSTGPQYDVFWQFTPTITTTYDVDTCGSSFDTTVSVHTGCPADDSNKIACNDDSTFNVGYPACTNFGTNSRIPAVLLNAGTTYFIRVAGYAGNRGSIVLNVNFVQSGACCDATTGNCTGTLTGSAGCAAGTVYQGDNTACSPNPCGQGACCDINTGNCTLSVATSCSGMFQGEASTCSAFLCGQGACCNDSTAGCTLTAQPGCFSGSTFQGAGSSCFSAICPTQACCDPTTGLCTTTGIAGTCAGNTTSQGPGSTCSPNPCPQPPTGACCLPATQTCTEVFGSTCASSGGSYQGDFSTCATSACPFGACCLPCTGCFVSTSGDCAGQSGTYSGDGSTCDAAGCSIINGGFESGAIAPGWTQFGDISDSGIFGPAPALSPGTGLVAHGGGYGMDFGPVDGAGGIQQTIPAHAGDTVTIGFWYAAAGATNSFDCTFDGVSLVSFVDDTAHTAWTQFTFPGIIVSADNPTLMFTITNPPSWDDIDDVTVCIESSTGGGVCCRGSTCNTSVAQASCTTGAGTAGAHFVSSVSACNTGNLSNSPCCYADYNKTNGITVQDIFDFLNDWFAGSIYAKVGGDGASGGLSVQNIFDFLNNWFAGGCS